MKKLLNFRLSLFIALSLILGITISYFFFMKVYILAGVFLVIFTASVALYFVFCNKEHLKALIFSLLFIAVFLLGFFIFKVDVLRYEKASLGNHYYNITARVKESYLSENTSKIILDEVMLEDAGRLNYNVALYTYGETDLRLGDTIKFYGLLEDNNAVYENRLNSSNLSKKIKFSIRIDSNSIEKTGKSLSVFDSISLFILDSLSSGLDGDELDIGYALLTGNSNNIDEEVISSFRNTGVAHIFAVSGLHIGFLGLALSLLLKKIPINKFIKAVFISLVLFLYSGVCGFSASSIRASIMTTIMLLLSAKGERYDGLSALSISAILILLFSPFELFTVGFQLSFLVVFGIIVLAPRLTRLFKFLPNKLASSVAVVLTAQIMGLPILLEAFGWFSIISIIVNLLFIPVVGVVYIALFLLTILGGIFNISYITLFLIKYVLLALKILIKFFDSNIFIVGGISLGIATLFYYAIVIINSDIINFKKIIRLISSIALSLIFITISIVNTLSLLSFKMIVSGDKDMSLTVFSENNKNVAIITEFSNNFSYYRLNRIKERENVNILNAVIIQDDCTVNDVFSLTTRLSYLFKIERIIVFKIVEPNIIESFNKSFPNVELIYALNGEVYSDFVSVKYSDYNRVVSVENKKTSVSIYPKYSGSDSVEFSKNNKADYVIGYNNLPLIFNGYNAQNISYLKSDEFIDAESQGNLKYYFSKG